ncbi:GTPase HflX [Aquisphaera giovannonii]|uniref:GTPase HflX n=1 Tax=Aquisphaera giovannonii TaxID=406548 RepID=A0A5B9W5I3_9BACT|nr:GTPase HflX [Aquisphaera giovannonii]QEH35577.1 GTPase HflX [Aquisphaera giovannonii]
MIEINRSERAGRHERAILVGVILPEFDGNPEDPLEEIRGLAETASLQVAGTMLQKRQQVDIATYIGSGKVDELKELVEAHEADVVVFDNDLGPGQTRNLEKALGVKVVDRTEVILDIFATHAKTHEAHLQVELAQLEYAMPRLKRMWTHLSRYKGGIGVRGPGEKQLEEDRRLVGHRIQELKAKLGKIQARKEREVAGRADVPTISLVGYTNAGKSTLMNALTGAGVLVEDMLFATLDTRTRKWRFKGGGAALLSDTVGFIRNLPHALVASFKATLEEARQADLLLHVVDASSPEAESQVRAVVEVLAELGLEDHPTLLVLNKADQVPDRSFLDVLRAHHRNSVTISAAKAEGLDRLEAAVREALLERELDAEVETGVSNGRVLAYLAQHAQIQDRAYDEDRVVLKCRIPRRCLNYLQENGVEVRSNGQRMYA